MTKRLLPLLLALSFVLAACIPVSDQVTNNFNRTFSDGQTTFFTVKSEGFVVLAYSPDEIAHEDPVITIVGDNLQYNSAECVPDGERLNCYPGTTVDGIRVMTSEQVFSLTMQGRNIVANVSYRQPGANKTYSQIAEVR